MTDKDVKDEDPLIGPNTSCRISPETTCSTNVNIHNATLPSNSSYNNNVVNRTKTMSTDDSSNNSNSNNKEQDRFLPIANVGRIMKKVIPGNGKISKDAKETVQECVSEFISFVTGEASEKCQREKRKTINGDDILWAIVTLGFEDYVNPLKVYLTKYREIEGEKLNVPKQRVVLEQQLQLDPHNSGIPYNNVYSSTNLISHPSFVSTDPSFSLPFDQNSVQATTQPQQDHINEHW